MFLPALYPELALFCGALIILMNDVFFAKNKPEFFRASYLIAILSCLASLYFTAHNTFVVGSFFHGMFFINSFTCFIKFVTSFSILHLEHFFSVDTSEIFQKRQIPESSSRFPGAVPCPVLFELAF